MFKSKYIIIVAIAMSVLGFVSQKQTHIPNQEIVLQFNTVEAASNGLQTAVSTLTQRLKDVGAHNIKLAKNQNGKLTITYYSSLDVVSVKKLFSKDKSLKLSFNIQNQQKPSKKVPFNDDQASNYQFQINEIQQDHTNNNDLNGVLLTDFDPKHHHLHFNSCLYSQISILKNPHTPIKVSALIYGNDGVVLHDISKSNPEVRAGPIS